MVTSVTPTLADAEMRMGAEGESAAVMSHTALSRGVAAVTSMTASASVGGSTCTSTSATWTSCTPCSSSTSCSASTSCSPSVGPSEIRNGNAHRETKREYPKDFHDGLL